VPVGAIQHRVAQHVGVVDADELQRVVAAVGAAGDLGEGVVVDGGLAAGPDRQRLLGTA
jgi:hypothetical protein